MVDIVSKQKGDTGEMLLALLETRLDNVVYRLGFAKTRFMSRQLVTHGHVMVNGKRLTIPSYHVQVDDVVSLHPKMQQNVQVLELVKEKPELLPFLSREGLSGKVVRAPKREDIEVLFSTQQIIEYYSR
jgi:small subunit ribosomal protein S4